MYTYCGSWICIHSPGRGWGLYDPVIMKDQDNKDPGIEISKKVLPAFGHLPPPAWRGIGIS